MRPLHLTLMCCLYRPFMTLHWENCLIQTKQDHSTCSSLVPDSFLLTIYFKLHRVTHCCVFVDEGCPTGIIRNVWIMHCINACYFGLELDQYWFEIVNISWNRINFCEANIWVQFHLLWYHNLTNHDFLSGKCLWKSFLYQLQW